jgi:hypothetical protein
VNICCVGGATYRFGFGFGFGFDFLILLCLGLIVGGGFVS